MAIGDLSPEIESIVVRPDLGYSVLAYADRLRDYCDATEVRWDMNMEIKSAVLRALLAAYTHPIVSGILTLMLASAALLTGIIDGLGSNFIPLIQKQDLIGTVLFNFLFVLFLAGLMRLLALLTHGFYIMSESVKPSTSEASVGIKILWIFGCLFVLISIALLTIRLVTPYSAVLLVAALVCAAVLVALVLAYLNLTDRMIIFLLQLIFLFSMFGLGRAWIDIQRVKPAGVRVYLKDGMKLDSNIVFSSPSGFIIYLTGSAEAEYHTWDSVDRIKVIELPGKSRTPIFGTDTVSGIVRFVCSLKAQADPDCKNGTR